MLTYLHYFTLTECVELLPWVYLTCLSMLPFPLQLTIFPKVSMSPDGRYICLSSFFSFPNTHNSLFPSQQPGRAEADFGRFDNKTVVRNVYTLFSRSEIPIARENQEIMDLVDSSTPLPPWFSEEDLANYGSLYQNSGFQTALKVPYR